MRGFFLFVVGILVGLAVQSGLAQNENGGTVALNHVGVSVPNIDDALAFYTETMGFPEAFRVTGANGELALVYVQISRNTFVELQPANAQRPPGISHFGLQVENMDRAVAMFTQRGASVGDIRVNDPTKVVLANITDLNGIRLELTEAPPDSTLGQAIQRWR